MTSVIGSASCGLVPQVTIGGMSAAIRSSWLSKFAPLSLGRRRHCPSARSQAPPLGE
jgi:hypothetical protein